MRAHVGRRGGEPDGYGRGHGNGNHGNQCGHVTGLRRGRHEPQRHRVLARIAAFDLYVVGGRVCWPIVVTHIDGMRVRGRPVIVVMIRVVVVAVRMHVLQRRRSGDRQHNRGDDGCDNAKHCGECMGTLWRRQTLRCGGPDGQWPTPRCRGVYCPTFALSRGRPRALDARPSGAAAGWAAR